MAFSERYLVVWGRDGGAVAVARQWIRCGTLAGQPQNAVLRAGDLWLLLRNCKPNFVLAAGYRVRAASCAHRGLPALFASVRRTRGHKRLSACAHGMPSNLSRPSRELLSSLAAKNFCCCCCKKISPLFLRVTAQTGVHMIYEDGFCWVGLCVGLVRVVGGGKLC